MSLHNLLQGQNYPFLIFTGGCDTGVEHDSAAAGALKEKTRKLKLLGLTDPMIQAVK
jgi:hypothetical protein